MRLFGLAMVTSSLLLLGGSIGCSRKGIDLDAKSLSYDDTRDAPKLLGGPGGPTMGGKKFPDRNPGAGKVPQ